jgi:carbamoylphosphate synthase large subunit
VRAHDKQRDFANHFLVHDVNARVGEAQSIAEAAFKPHAKARALPAVGPVQAAALGHVPLRTFFSYIETDLLFKIELFIDGVRKQYEDRVKKGGNHSFDRIILGRSFFNDVIDCCKRSQRK